MTSAEPATSARLTPGHRAPGGSPRWARRWLIAAGIYNLLWGGAMILFPRQTLAMLGVAPQFDAVWPELWACIGMIVGVYGVGYLAITARTQDGFPSEFERLPAGSITRRDQSGPVFFAPSKELYFLGQELDYRNVVQFISGIQGIIYQSPGVVNTALKLESSRYRNAESLIPSGVLRQTGGEPLSPSELSAIGAQFESARKLNQIAVLNEFLSFEPSQATPDKMLLIDAANYQALECARLTNVPPYLVGVSTGSYSYQSSQQARADLYIFGVKAYAECIANTLSMDNVLPRGTYVKFDADEYLEENYLADKMEEPDMPEENTQEEIAS